MSYNKLALLRYKTIDECLQNRFKQWTLEHLIEAVSDKLYEYEGMDSGVSKRTIQLDIQNMRSDKLGYNAPIIVIDRKFYTYEDKNFSINNSKISHQDIDKLQEIIKVLQQFKGFNYFEDIHEMIGRIEDKITKHETNEKHYIDFEKNDLLKGLQWIEHLLIYVKNNLVIELEYQSFKARNASKIVMSPYLLKEYRNRWFLLAKTHKYKTISTFALDRVINIIEKPVEDYIENTEIDLKSFYNDVIGVTKSIGQKAMLVKLWVSNNNAPYVITKPIHSSQEIISRDENGVLFQINVVHNFELEREILGFGDSMRVISPRILKNRIYKNLTSSVEVYNIFD